MSQRDRDARAAMREILRAGLQLAKVADCASLAEMAWSVADAMATERRKREAAEAPAPEHHACHAEIAAAMREGRDAGMREARGQCEHGLPVYGALAKDADRLTERLRAMADENAKLRAVAEAAARLQRWRETDHGKNSEGVAVTSRLIGALDAALPNWRTAP